MGHFTNGLIMAQLQTDSLFNDLGMDFFEQDIDEVIFQTNQFLTDPTFTGANGPFWWILEMCLALAALFSIVVGGSMAYKMMVKGEGFDPLKILRILGISMVMVMWYNNSILDILAYIPNKIGGYTKALYDIEATNVDQKFQSIQPLLRKRNAMFEEIAGDHAKDKSNLETAKSLAVTQEATTAGAELTDSVASRQSALEKYGISQTFCGVTIAIDKLVMILALVFFKVGWWGTIFVQQLLLGMLTIFGPIQWAFSILPKWEGAWAKWLTRYLTVHFYGAMLYFVGFYVLLLFDIVFQIQLENLEVVVASNDDFLPYVRSAFMTAGYLLVASIVSLKCLNLVPDLAAWMIPEGDTAFSTRSFGEGIASQAKASSSALMR